MGYNTASTLAAPLLSPTGTPLPAPGTFLVADQRRARSVQPKEDPSMVEVPEALKGLLGEKSVAATAHNAQCTRDCSRGENEAQSVVSELRFDCSLRFLYSVVCRCRCVSQAFSPHTR